MTKLRSLFLFLTVLIVAAPSVARAGEFAVRLGAGPAFAGDIGGSGLLALQFTHGTGILRVDTRGIWTGSEAGKSARALAYGVGAGVCSPRSAAGHRRYLLATIERGIDLRESDRLTSLGAALGYDIARRPGLFGELRYEHWIQHGVEYYRLPSDMVSVVVGFVIS